jgi:hypothetical protein
MGFSPIDLMLPIGMGGGQSTSTGNGTPRPFVESAELVNLRLQPTPKGSQRPFSLVNVPAIDNRVSTGSGNIRGMLIHGGLIWWVRGTTLRTLALYSGSATSVGTINGTAPVHMVGVDTQKIFITDEAGHQYLADTSSVTAVTAPAGNFGDCTHIDGYTFAIRVGTDECYASALDDPTTWSALSFTTADAKADVLIGCTTKNRELILMGKNHGEVWYDAATTPFPFARAQPGVIDRGLWSAASMCIYEEALYFLADDLRVYRMPGYVPERISDPWIEHLISTAAVIAGRSGCRASIYQLDGLSYYSLSAQANGSGYTPTSFVYCIDTGRWHVEKHATSGVHFVDIANHIVDTQSSLTVAAVRTDDASLGDGLYLLEIGGVDRDASVAPVSDRIITFQPIGYDGRRAFISEFFLSVSSNCWRYAQLSFSDDDGETFYEMPRPDPDPASGTVFLEARWSRLGSFLQKRIFRITVPVYRVLIDAAQVMIEVGG